jgi:general stress protein 26
MTDKTIHDFWEELEDDRYVMLGLIGDGNHAIPMTAQTDKSTYGQFWFFTTKDNRLAKGGPAMAQFISKDHKIFACMKGNLVEEISKERLDKHWSNAVEAWYDGGKEDPNLLMLRYELDSVEVWEQDMTMKGKFKLLTGTTIKPGEAGDHKEKVF